MHEIIRPEDEITPDMVYFVFQQTISRNGHWDNGVRIGVGEVSAYEEEGWTAIFSKEVWQTSLFNFIPKYSYAQRLGRAIGSAEKIYAQLIKEDSHIAASAT